MAHEPYDHAAVEKKWQRRWREAALYETPDAAEGKENYYQLVEFPYPSGNLHVGHWYAMCGPDIHARYMRMRGYNVLFPIGFDAFGLPAENAAIKHNLNPAQWTEDNMAHMRTQIDAMGASFDRSREVVTCHPDYYKHTQWLFAQLFRAGLVERKTTQANWCPSCKTVLANEQVVADACERCDTPIEKKSMPQWQLKITRYADRLIDDLDTLDWPEEIKVSQRNWIGRSEGAEIDFPVHISHGSASRVVLMHGKDATPQDKWYPWLVREMEKRGVHVDVPALPQTHNPVLQGWVDVLKSLHPTANTVLVGHSRGGVAILRYLEQLPDDQKVGKVILVATNYAKTDARHTEESTNGFYTDSGYDWEEIRRHCDEIVVLHSRDDQTVPFENGEIIAKKLGAKFLAFDDRGLFGSTLKKQEIPELIEEILTNKKITVFTTRPDTLFGATYVVMAPEHERVRAWLADGVIANAQEVRDYIAAARKKSDMERTAEGKEKTGVRLEGVTVTNPANGEELPVFVADYVLAHYGTGAIMAVPAHDQRDFDFARKYDLPIVDVISGRTDEAAAYTGDGTLINSGAFDGMTSTEAKRAITEAVGGRMTTTYRLRDWGVSRQRYWGCPIPLVHCATCAARGERDAKAAQPGWFAVPDAQLPVELPAVDDYLPRDDGRSPLAKNEDFVRTVCPRCGGAAERETDTMDTFVDSSWYFLRYTDPHNDARFASKEKLAHWMPVDFYSGGAEHTTMHLLYSRFFHKALYDLGLVRESEPYVRRRNRGLILGPDGNKMSKSKGNVIDPDDIVRDLGADTMRLYLAFIGPYNETGNYPWNPQSIIGVRRFVDRVWRLREKCADATPVDARVADKALHTALAHVTQSIEDFKLNTGVAALMRCLNTLEKADALTPAQLALFAQMLAPYAPHIAEELWEHAGGKESVHTSTWPQVDETLLAEDTMTLAVQVNGKVRAEITVPADADEATVTQTALAHERVRKHLDGAAPKKTIYVKGRLVNIVA